jgi:CTP synthase
VCSRLTAAQVLEVARNLLNLPTANSTEFDQGTPHPVVEYMPEISRTVMGGSMRLGAPCGREGL